MQAPPSCSPEQNKAGTEKECMEWKDFIKQYRKLPTLKKITLHCLFAGKFFFQVALESWQAWVIIPCHALPHIKKYGCIIAPKAWQPGDRAAVLHASLLPPTCCLPPKIPAETVFAAPKAFSTKGKSKINKTGANTNKKTSQNQVVNGTAFFYYLMIWLWIV